MDAVLQDLRYAARSLRRQPAFALLAIGTLALGIGANAAIFSVVNAVLLRPLGYYRPDRIVALTTHWQKTGRRGTVSAPDFHDWHDATSSFAAMAYYTYDLDFETSVNVDGVADYGSVVLVTPEFFDVFGVDALVGRRIARTAALGDAPVAVISHEFWLRRFGGSSGVIGRTGHVRPARRDDRRRDAARVRISRPHRHLVLPVGQRRDRLALRAQLPRRRAAEGRRCGEPGTG